MVPEGDASVACIRDILQNSASFNADGTHPLGLLWSYIMKLQMSALTLMLIVFSTPSHAETLQQIRSRLGIIYKGLNHQEVQIKGAIGTFISDRIKFADKTGVYDVQFDAGREARRKIEGCTINMFSPEKSECQIQGKAEIIIDSSDKNLGDGFKIELSIFSMSLLSRK